MTIVMMHERRKARASDGYFRHSPVRHYKPASPSLDDASGGPLSSHTQINRGRFCSSTRSPLPHNTPTANVAR